MTTRLEEVSIKELAILMASDGELFGKTILPNTFRQEMAPFHKDVWELLEDRTHRNVAIKMFRGSAKTTLLRAYTLKRIAYGVSRTILFTSASQGHAIKSVLWIRNQVERNALLQQIYSVVPGQKWTDEWLTIHHKVLGIDINVVAAGITGQTRGLNIDDYRPDLIVCDDPCDEENTGTEEQREKTKNRFFGAIDKSLAPKTESPDAKIVLLQTPFVDGDLIDLCCKDPAWAAREYSCFDEDGESRWPTRFPTKVLADDKRSHISRGQLRLWLREMEVAVTADEFNDFRADQLQFWETFEAEARIPTFMAIDPVPPPSETETKKDFREKDFEVLAVVGVSRGRFYVLDVSRNRGHQPEWTIAEFFRLASKWRPLKIRVEPVNYQRTLAWILDREMRERRSFWALDISSDKRRKRHRIVQALSGIASKGLLYVHPSQTALIEQFANFPNVKHDDDIDAVSMAIDLAVQYGEGIEGLDEEGVPLLGAASMARLEAAWHSAP